MRLSVASLVLVSFLLSVNALRVPSLAARQDGNNGIHLAVSPICGPLSGNVSDVNAGIDLSKIKTIVAFGVSPSMFAHRRLSPSCPICYRTRTPTEVVKMVALFHHQSSCRPTPEQEDGQPTARYGWRTLPMTLGLRSWTTRYVRYSRMSCTTCPCPIYTPSNLAL